MPVLMISERAIVFEKIRIRFCRNMILYAIPESPDVIEAIEDMMNLEFWDKILQHRLRVLKTQAGKKDSTLSDAKLVDECKKVIKEGEIQNKNRSVVGLFSQYDGAVLERLVGTLKFKTMLTTQTRDSFTI